MVCDNCAVCTFLVAPPLREGSVNTQKLLVCCMVSFLSGRELLGGVCTGSTVLHKHCTYAQERRVTENLKGFV